MSITFITKRTYSFKFPEAEEVRLLTCEELKTYSELIKTASCFVTPDLLYVKAEENDMVHDCGLKLPESGSGNWPVIVFKDYLQRCGLDPGDIISLDPEFKFPEYCFTVLNETTAVCNACIFGESLDESGAYDGSDIESRVNAWYEGMKLRFPECFEKKKEPRKRHFYPVFDYKKDYSEIFSTAIGQKVHSIIDKFDSEIINIDDEGTFEYKMPGTNIICDEPFEYFIRKSITFYDSEWQDKVDKIAQELQDEAERIIREKTVDVEYKAKYGIFRGGEPVYLLNSTEFEARIVLDQLGREQHKVHRKNMKNYVWKELKLYELDDEGEEIASVSYH